MENEKDLIKSIDRLIENSLMGQRKLKAEVLSREHWAYIKGVLEAHEISDGDITLVEYHYITAFEHGYKHGVENTLMEVEK